MDCLLKFSLGCTLKNIIQKIIDKNNNYHQLIRTDDWKLAANLDSQIKNRTVCERECLGCLEFYRVTSMFNNLTHSIITANNEHNLLTDHLCKKFNISDVSDPICLALDLTAAPDYVKSRIDTDVIPSYEKYVTTINGAFYSLALDHYNHEKAKCSGTILSQGDLEQRQIISYIPFKIQQHQKAFYLDQNIISKYSNDSNLKKQIKNFKHKTKCQLIYSPYLIEDGIKMSQVRLDEYFSNVEELTDCSMLVRIGGNIRFVKEDIKITSNRVLLWRHATRATEDLKVNKMHFNRWGYPHYARDSHLSKRANENINEFLESLRPHLDNDEHEIASDDFESDHALCRRLYAATIEKSFSLEELVDRSIKFKNDSECIEHIEGLCEFLDLINYQTEPLSAVEKIRSSLQDVEHLKYAWKTDYFVTEDNRLRTRGEFIYSILKLKTEFINLAKFKSLIADEFRLNN